MRLFLALDLPPAFRGEADRVAGELRERGEGWRWVRSEGIHLTLRFLGEVDASRELQGRDAWRAAAAAAQPFELRLTDVGTFPRSGRLRVLWIGVEETRAGGVLPRLARSLERAARALGYEPEERELRPHLTLARALRGGRPKAPEGMRVEPTRGWIDSLVLFRSELRTGGARYTAVERFGLGKSDEEREG